VSKSVKPKLIAGAVAGLAVAGGGAALAATQLGSSPKQENQAIVNDAAKQLGVQPSALNAALKKALENRVDAAVAAGRLTKAEGAEIKQRIEAGDVPLFGRPGGPGGFRHHHGGPFGGLDAAATYLGLTQAQLRTQLESGKSMADVAKAKNKSVDGLVSALVDAAKKKLDSAVAAGQLTQKQADSILSDLKSHVTDFVNGVRPPRPDGDNGFSFRGGPRFDGPRL
jgi:polyhydroxyalkanoate synthesis regulator phasin